MFDQAVKQAKRVYELAIKHDGKNAGLLLQYAKFSTDVARSDDEAERRYQDARKLAPERSDIASAFGWFQWGVRQNYSEAEKLFRDAYRLEPDMTRRLHVLASFLSFHLRSTTRWWNFMTKPRRPSLTMPPSSATERQLNTSARKRGTNKNKKGSRKIQGIAPVVAAQREQRVELRRVPTGL